MGWNYLLEIDAKFEACGDEKMLATWPAAELRRQFFGGCDPHN